jgi:SAM-dependent methyltransferase
MPNSDFEARRQHAFNKLLWHVPEANRQGRFLDIGCGTGNGVLAALQHGAALAVGVDRTFDEFAHLLTREQFNDVCTEAGADHKRALFVAGDIFDYAFAPGSFDTVMMLDAIEHVPNPRDFIRYAFDALAPGGVFLLDTCPLYYSAVGHHLWEQFPEDTDPWAHLMDGFEDRLAASSANEWVIDRYRELNKVTRGDILGWMAECGFEIALNHQDAPTAEQFAQFEQRRHLIGAPVSEEALLDRWVLIVARKPS